jgi:spore germination protein
MSEIVDNKLLQKKQDKSSKTTICSYVDKNVDNLKNKMKNCADLVLREFPVGENKNVKVVITYIDGMVNRDLIDFRVVEPIMFYGRGVLPKIEDIQKAELENSHRLNSKKDTTENNTISVFEFIRDGGIATADLKEIETLEESLDAILSGDTVLFVDGYEKAFTIATKGWPNRGIQPPTTEAIIRGPADGFTETFRMNTALIRRRIRDTRLKIEQIKIGERSGTDIAIIYIDDIVNKNVLKEVQKRLNEINIDAILESGYIEQLIEDNKYCLFPQIQNTQRPDEAVGAILEGKVVILVDNTPFVLIAPATFNSFLQVSEDYYDRWITVSVLRLLRYMAFFIAIGFTALYIAIISFHPDFIPVSLLLNIAATRSGVPFPAFLEAIFMELTIEVLREAGERLPGLIGQTIGIVGGLVIGQAAVSAGIVSPIMVIIVAFTAIASFAIPNYNMTAGIRVYKFILIIAASILGFYGFVVGMLILLIQLVKQKSFGVPYLSPFVSLEAQDLKDTCVRMPLNTMGRRPSLVYSNRKRAQYKK